MDKKIEVFPGWEIVEKIGEGGFSTVYKIRKTDSADFGEYYAAMKVVSIPRSKEEYTSWTLEGYDEATIEGIITNQVNKIVEEFANIIVEIVIQEE
jgi:serine/threonine protein kinase